MTPQQQQILDLRYMREALKEAEAAARDDEVPVGAVVVSPSGRIIGRGHNMTERLGDVTAHAEILAITAAEQALGSKFLEGCRVYVTVEPCVMCAGALAWARPDAIIIGARDPKKGFLSQYALTPFRPGTEVSFGLLGDEASKMMTDFFAAKRK